MRVASLFTVAALGVFCSGLFAADEEKFTDQMFVEKAAIGGMFEVKSSQLAQQMAGNIAVKNFAARMVADHTQANAELTNLARQKGWRLPTSVDKKHQDMLAQLRQTQGGGDQFDRLYAQDQLKAHEKTVALFEKAVQDARDPDLKTWANKTLPTLKEHLQMARHLNTNGTGPAASTTVPPAASNTVPPATRRTPPR